VQIARISVRPRVQRLHVDANQPRLRIQIAELDVLPYVFLRISIIQNLLL